VTIGPLAAKERPIYSQKKKKERKRKKVILARAGGRQGGGIEKKGGGRLRSPGLERRQGADHGALWVSFRKSKQHPGDENLDEF